MMQRRLRESLIAQTLIGAAVLMVALPVSRAYGVIVASGDGRNLAPPPEPLLHAWNLEGQFGQFVGTPISSTAMITAKHVTNNAGPFTFAGHTYTINATPIDIAGTDLRIWTLNTAADATLFPTWAPLWNASTDGSEVGKTLTVFGNGRARGDAILAPTNPGPTVGPVTPATLSITLANSAVRVRSLTGGNGGTLAASATASPPGLTGPTPQTPADVRGWRLGAYDGQRSWGQNVVDSIETDPTYSDLLLYDFDGPNTPDAIPNEAMLAQYDSGGGVFIQSNGVWKLAGINLGADSTYATTPENLVDSLYDDHIARNAIFDASGLYTYVGDGADADTNPDIAQVGYADGPLAPSSYSSRISPHYAAILAALGGTAAFASPEASLVPEPGCVAAWLTGVAVSMQRRRRSW